MFVDVSVAVQTEVEKTSQSRKKMPRRFQQLHDVLVERKRAQGKRRGKLILLGSFAIAGGAFFLNSHFHFVGFHGLFWVVVCLAYGCQSDTVALTMSELFDAFIESEEDSFWQGYEALAKQVMKALQREADKVPDHCLPRYLEMVEKTNKDAIIARFRCLRDAKCMECGLCRCWKEKSQLVHCSHPNPNHQHKCCRECLETWVSQPAQLEKMIERRSCVIPCFFVEDDGRCRGTFLQESLPECACRNPLTCSCSGFSRLRKDLERRHYFMKHAGCKRRFSGNIVECPQADCVGVGYGETGIAMCFLCENQWEVPKTNWFGWLGLGRDDWTSPLPPGCKRCPSCQVTIEKNGGCDHMTCRCGHQFWWSSRRKFE